MIRGMQVIAWLTVSLATLPAAAEATVGSPAPPVEPTDWVNTKGPTSWKDLKGRVILIDKWATWCGPCVASIPHLNELHDKYEKKGLTIIGVTDEGLPAANIKSFIESKGVKYTIALKGADEYKTSSIPHGWLISPKGEVVWKGHPAELKESMIEEQLKEARLTPTFSLPKELKSAEKDLNAGKYAASIKTLEEHLKKPKSAATEAAAKSAVAQVNAYGASQLQQVDELAKEKDYGSGAEILRNLEKSFKGLETGDKASKLLADWKKDEKIKLELDGASFVEKADAQIQAKQFKNAAGFLLQVTKPKKFEGTKVREIAAKKLAAVERKL